MSKTERTPLKSPVTSFWPLLVRMKPTAFTPDSSSNAASWLPVEVAKTLATREQNPLSVGGRRAAFFQPPGVDKLYVQPSALSIDPKLLSKQKYLRSFAHPRKRLR